MHGISDAVSGLSEYELNPDHSDEYGAPTYVEEADDVVETSRPSRKQ